MIMTGLSGGEEAAILAQSARQGQQNAIARSLLRPRIVHETVELA
jgi:hypothetical protein